MEQGIETISSGSSSNGGGHCQTKVGKVGGKVIFRGSHFSPSPNPVLTINPLPMLSYLFFFFNRFNHYLFGDDLHNLYLWINLSLSFRLIYSSPI